jgi:hypothetical protein
MHMINVVRQAVRSPEIQTSNWQRNQRNNERKDLVKYAANHESEQKNLPAKDKVNRQRKPSHTKVRMPCIQDQNLVPLYMCVHVRTNTEAKTTPKKFDEPGRSSEKGREETPYEYGSQNNTKKRIDVTKQEYERRHDGEEGRWVE